MPPGKRVIIGKGRHDHVAGGEIGELCGSASARQCCCPLRVSVIDEHLMTVFNEVDGKRVSHMAETDHTDTSDDEFGGHEFLAGGKAGDSQQLVSRVMRVLDTRACRGAVE